MIGDIPMSALRRKSILRMDELASELGIEPKHNNRLNSFDNNLNESKQKYFENSLYEKSKDVDTTELDLQHTTDMVLIGKINMCIV
jgi:hypothetical protein